MSEEMLLDPLTGSILLQELARKGCVFLRVEVLKGCSIDPVAQGDGELYGDGMGTKG